MKAIWFRAIIMSISFAAVAYTIHKMNSSDSFQKGLHFLFSTAPEGKGLMWCETRVNEIEVPGKIRIYQEGMKWFREAKDGTVSELGFVPVEKWFAEYCQLKVDGITEGFVDNTVENNENILARVGFIKGEHKNFVTIDADLFGWGNMNFRSHILPKALKELEDLPHTGGSPKGKAPGH